MGAFIRSDSPEAALEWGGVSCVRFFLLNFTVLLYNFSTGHFLCLYAEAKLLYSI